MNQNPHNGADAPAHPAAAQELFRGMPVEPPPPLPSYVAVVYPSEVTLGGDVDEIQVSHTARQKLIEAQRHDALERVVVLPEEDYIRLAVRGEVEHHRAASILERIAAHRSDMVSPILRAAAAEIRGGREEVPR